MADKIKHPKKKRRPVKTVPCIPVFEKVVSNAEIAEYCLNQLRRTRIIIVKASRKTNATKDELEQLQKRAAFFEAAAKALKLVPDDEPEVIAREGFEGLFVPPPVKNSQTIVWTKKNLPPDNPIYPNKSVYALVTNEANATFVACYNYEKEQWENREGKVCRNIIAHHPLNSSQE